MAGADAMDKRPLRLRVADLEGPDQGKSQEAFEAILGSFAEDPFFDSGDRRQLLRRLGRMEGGRAQALLGEIARLRSPEELQGEALAYAMRRARIPRKEHDEVRYFHQLVRSVLRGYRNGPLALVVDVCSGNGMNGLYWVLQGSAERALLVDRVATRPYRAFTRALEERVPGTAGQYAFSSDGIDGVQGTALPEQAALLGIHACGELTDRLIAKAVEVQRPVAVMTCCHAYQGEVLPAGVLPYLEDKAECMDAVRAVRLSDAGWSVALRRLPPGVTEKNRILIGAPPGYPSASA